MNENQPPSSEEPGLNELFKQHDSSVDIDSSKSSTPLATVLSGRDHPLRFGEMQCDDESIVSAISSASTVCASGSRSSRSSRKPSTTSSLSSWGSKSSRKKSSTSDQIEVFTSKKDSKKIKMPCDEENLLAGIDTDNSSIICVSGSRCSRRSKRSLGSKRSRASLSSPWGSKSSRSNGSSTSKKRSKLDGKQLEEDLFAGVDNANASEIDEAIDQILAAASSNGKYKIVKDFSSDWLPRNAKRVPSFFRQICLDNKATRETVEYLLDAFPGAPCTPTIEFCPQRNTQSYLLHLACYIETCPSSVVKLLVKRNPLVLRHPCIVEVDGNEVRDYVEGLPLHYFLSRASNRDFETVKMLVDLYPKALLTAAPKSRFTPLHTLLCNPNPEDMYKTARYLIESEHSILRLTDNQNRTPLHIACTNKNMDPKVIRMILDWWPQSIAILDAVSGLPIHTLCYANNGPDETDERESLKILAIFIDAYPVAAHHVDNGGDLPIHIAANNKSPAFCKMLVDAHPQSPKIQSNDGILPIHQACCFGRLETVKYLLELCPESIGISTDAGFLPIHEASYRLEGKQAELIDYLLSRDNKDSVARPTSESHHLPLHLACDSSNVNLNAVQLLFDAYPDAICIVDKDGRSPLDIAKSHQSHRVRYPKAIKFLETALTYVDKAHDITAMTTPDSNGWLPLHHELNNKASLGIIKLLVQGNPLALQVADPNGLYPLHIACEFCTVDVVKFLLDLDGSCLDYCDKKGNSPFHTACRGGNFGVVKYFIERYNSSVSQRNSDKKLPIHLLCEFGKDGSCESPEYTETIWQLLLAYPESVME